MKAKTIIIISAIFFILPFIFYFLNFNGEFSSVDSSWSNFGSFIGGIGATIFSFASFITIIITYQKQNEINQQEKIESLFFRYIELLNNSRSNLVLDLFGKMRISGVEIINRFNGFGALFDTLNQELETNYKMDQNSFLKDHADLESNILIFEFLRDSITGYSNTAIATLEFLKTQPTDCGKYFSIFFSQLSNQEKMCLIALNSDFFNKNINIKKQIGRAHV